LNHKDTKDAKFTKTTRDPIPIEVEQVAKAVVDCAYTIHRALGPGLLESVYEICMLHELHKRGLKAERQVGLPIVYDGIGIDCALRIDLMVEDCLIVELKAVEQLLPIHRAQLVTYLKLTGHRLGLLINFNVPLIKDGIRRVIY
jgi:GxxExxY protein